MLNVLYVSNSGQYGGMELHIADLVSGMRKAGNAVFVWCPDGPIVAEYESRGANVTLEEVLSDVDLGYMKRISKFIKNNRIDVVHSHEPKASLNSLIPAKFSGVSVRISHTHTPVSEWAVSRVKKFVTSSVYSLLVNHVSTYEIALTSSVREIKEKEGISKSKLRVIPNGVEEEKFLIEESSLIEMRKQARDKLGIPETGFIIGNWSRLSREKGHDFLIKASGLLNDPSLYVVLLSGGILENDLKSLAESLLLPDRIRIVGGFNEEEKRFWASCFDLVCFPSLAEGFGFVPLEAMLLGLPVLCSDLPVIRDVCQDNVFYFDLSNASDLSLKIKTLKESADLRLSKLSKSKVYVQQNFGMKKFQDSYLGLYDEAMKGHT